MRRKKKRWILRLFLVAFTVYAAYSIISLQLQIAERRREQAALEAAITEETQKNQQLQAQIDSELTDEQIEQIARAELGYAYPDEQVYIATQGS